MLVYRAIGSNIHNFVDCLEQLFSGLSVLKTIFICGDFNTNILKHDSDHGVNLFLDNIYFMGLYPLIDRPSRITNHSFTLIDNIFTIASDYDNTSGLPIYDVSDHISDHGLYSHIALAGGIAHVCRSVPRVRALQLSLAVM